MNLLITPAQAIGHKIPDLETSPRILQKLGNKKMMSFWRKLIIGNLVCIKTCYSFKTAKPFQRPKTQVPKIVIFWNHRDLCLGTCWPKIALSLGILLSHIFSFGQKWYEKPRTKSQPSQNDPHMRRDASIWKVIYDMRCCPKWTGHENERIKKKQKTKKQKQKNKKQKKNWLSRHALEKFD